MIEHFLISIGFILGIMEALLFLWIFADFSPSAAFLLTVRTESKIYNMENNVGTTVSGRCENKLETFNVYLRISYHPFT